MGDSQPSMELCTKAPSGAESPAGGRRAEGGEGMPDHEPAAVIVCDEDPGRGTERPQEPRLVCVDSHMRRSITFSVTCPHGARVTSGAIEPSSVIPNAGYTALANSVPSSKANVTAVSSCNPRTRAHVVAHVLMMFSAAATSATIRARQPKARARLRQAAAHVGCRGIGGTL